MNSTFLIFVSLMGLLSSTHGNLMLSFTGTHGSSIVSWEASGSVTVTNAVATITNGFGRAPVDSGPSGNITTWATAFDNNLGTGIVKTEFGKTEFGFTSGAISYSADGVVFGSIDFVDIGTDGSGDDFEPDPSVSLIYPAVDAGDEVSWAGSGTLDLGASSFEDVFDVAVGTTESLSNPISGGSYTVSVTAVPEPSSFLFGGGLAMLLICHRRRRVA